MKRTKITITDNGKVSAPSETRMSVAEIADLFDIYYQTTQRLIRTIEKSGVAGGDYSMSCVVEGQKVVPAYYGLEMIIVVSFRVQSKNAELFRKWVLEKVSRIEVPQIPRVLILSTQNSSLN